MGEASFRIYVCAGMHCTPAGRQGILRALEDALWEFNLGGRVEIRESSCLNRCAHAPNVTVWPGPFRYTCLTPQIMRQIVERHIGRGEPLAEHLFEPPADQPPSSSAPLPGSSGVR